MKKMFFVGVFIAPLIGFSQGVVQMNDMNVLYLGYENVIEIGIPKGFDQFTVFAEGATLEKKKDSWIVKTLDQRFATIGVLNVKGDTLSKQVYRCIHMPRPQIYFGEVSDGGAVTDFSTVLSIKYSQNMCPTPMLKWNLLSFELQIPNDAKVYAVAGDQIPEGIQEIIKAKPLPFTISIIAIVEGPDGIRRKQAGIFTFVP